jgi:hypothetical protein
LLFWWDEELLHEIFWPIDANRILRIPLSDGMEDCVAWHYSKLGVFSVRSAYHVEWEHQHGRKLRRTSGLGSAEINSVWKELWRLNIPAKIKKFNWKALHGTLPCRAILADRHMKVSAQCPVCSHGAEDVRHALFTCDRAKKVWRALGLEEFINEALAYDRAGSVSLEYLIGLSRKKSPILGQPNLQTMFAVASWYIWWERRQVVKGEKLQSAQRSAMSITVLASNFSAVAQSKGDSGVRRHGWEHYRNAAVCRRL